MIDFGLSEDQEALQRAAREFCVRNVRGASSATTR
jgi:hypothetical protein